MCGTFTYATSMRTVGDVVNPTTGTIKYLSDLPHKVPAWSRQRVKEDWPSALLKFIAAYDTHDPSTHTITYPIPSPTQRLTNATAEDDINQSIRTCTDILNSINFYEDPPLPADCREHTAKWWKSMDAGLRHWQFKYTIGAYPTRTRLSHLPEYQPATFRLCRNCHAAEETLDHLF
jgi:hypothetical protein